MPTITVLEQLTSYRVRLTYADGHITDIGDWPTRRLALEGAQQWIGQFTRE